MRLANKKWVMRKRTVLFHVSFLVPYKPLVGLFSCIIGVSHRICITGDFQIYSSINVRLLIILQITPCIGYHLCWTQYKALKGQHTLCACARIDRHVCVNAVFSEYQTEYFNGLIFLNKKLYCSCWEQENTISRPEVSIKENYNHFWHNETFFKLFWKTEVYQL